MDSISVALRGSLKKDGHRYLLSVPVHSNKAIAPGTLRSLIRDSGLTIEEFTEYVRATGHG